MLLTFDIKRHFDCSPAGLLFGQQAELHWRAGRHFWSRKVPVLPTNTPKYDINYKKKQPLYSKDAGSDTVKHRAKSLHYWLAEELHRQEPGVTAEGSVLTAAGANTVVDLGDVGCDVLYGCVVKTVDPKTRVSILHLALQIVEGPCRMLQGWMKHAKI